MGAGGSASEEALARAWQWLSTLPRAVTAHGDRGADPLIAVRTLLSALGDPQDRLRSIHIAGSKGKGSTALFIEALLLRLGKRPFTFTSPHLERWTERLRIDGEEANAQDALASVHPLEFGFGVTPRK